MHSHVLIFCILAGSNLMAIGQDAQLWTSSRDNPNRLAPSTIAVTPFNSSDPATAVVINPSIRYQQIWGFGAALTDASADTFFNLNRTSQKIVLEAYFGKDSANYNVMRLPIGSTDFSIRSYSLAPLIAETDPNYLPKNINASNPLYKLAANGSMSPSVLRKTFPNVVFQPTKDDFEMKNFNLDHGIYKDELVPLLKEAMAFRHRPLELPYNGPLYPSSVNLPGVRDDEIKILATPWAPPAWMKENNKRENPSKLIGLKNGTEYQQAYALYVSKFVSDFKSRFNVSIWAVTPQNEPQTKVTWESCYFSPESMRDYIRNYFGPILKRNNPGTMILGYDGQKDVLGKWAQVCLTDPQISKYVDGTAHHWYTGPHFDELDRLHTNFPNMFQFSSEQTLGYKPFPLGRRGPSLNSWSRGEVYSHGIIGDLNNWSTGWLDWNLILNSKGGPNHANNMCDAAIIADLTAGQENLHFQPIYYHMVHFSRWLPRYSVRIMNALLNKETPEMTSIGDNDGYLLDEMGPLSRKYVQITSFLRPDNQITVIILNRMRKEHVVNFVLNTFRSYRVTLPPRSIQTLLIPNGSM